MTNTKQCIIVVVAESEQEQEPEKNNIFSTCFANKLVKPGKEIKFYISNADLSLLAAYFEGFLKILIVQRKNHPRVFTT